MLYYDRGCSYTLYNISNFVGLQAVKSNHSVVTYEVMLSIQRLVGKCGVELQDPAWDLVLSIIEAIISYVGSFFFPIMLFLWMRVLIFHYCLKMYSKLSWLIAARERMNNKET